MDNTEKQTITANASPRPWRVNGHTIEANDPEGLWLQNEKTGWGVVANLPSCPKSRMSKKNRETWDAIVDANAALIVDAVNERDRLRDELTRKAKNYEYDIAFHTRTEAGLRDIVRRLADSLQGIMDAADGKGEGVLDESLLREARAAIGEYML